MKKQAKFAKRYAKMLVEVSGLDKAQKAIEDIKTVSSLMGSSRDINIMLTGPQFSDDEKHKVIKQIGAEIKCAEDTVKFLSYISDKKAMAVLDEIAKAAFAVYLERKNMAKATVVTPSAVSKEYHARIMSAIKKVTGRETEVEYETDQSLIGGMLVKVGSTMYDGSIKGQLRLLKDELAKG